MEHYTAKIKETNLIDFWKAKADIYSTEKMDLTDDDTISDYLNTYKSQLNLNEQEWTKLNRLIISNWFIQQEAFCAGEYKIIEYREVFEKISKDNEE